MSNGAESGWSKVWRVLVNPMQGMATVAERPTVWPGYLVQMAATVVIVALTLNKTVAATVEKLAASGIPPEAMGVAKISGAITGLLLALGMPWLGGLILGLVLKLVGLFQGGTATFRSYLALYGYARVPAVLGGILQAVLAIPAATVPEANKVTISLAALAPNAAGVTRAFLTTLNPFEIWSLALFVIGYAALNRYKLAKGVAAGVVLYLITLVSLFAGTSRSVSL